MAAPAIHLAAARLAAPAFEPGSVWLAGAGPGDPGLLTLHAAHALALADVVLHDALVSPDILALAGAARLEAVGKRAGGVRTSQLRINERLIGLARANLRVLRLKGGDPMVFGRGGEEALALAAAAIPFRIIPGVSAGIGGTATAAIPLTYRGLARSVAFATGRDRSGGLPDLDFAALSRGAETLVFYMALQRTDELARALMDAGRDANEPVAFVSAATTPNQRVTTATLASAGAVAASLPMSAPTLMVVGPVLALRDILDPLQRSQPMTIAPSRSLATAS